MKVKLRIPKTEKEKEEIYIFAFGKKYDDPNRKQFPLPIDIACMVAMYTIEKTGLYVFE